MIPSPWALYPWINANSSFNEPVPVPTSAPDVGPFVCAPISLQWLLVALGALDQLRQPVAWQVTTEAEIDAIMHQVDQFIGMVAGANMCPEFGSVSITILAGDSDASTAVSFPVAFSAAPVVVQSTDSEVLIASSQSVIDSGFTATITAATPVLVNTTALYSWIAAPST